MYIMPRLTSDLQENYGQQVNRSKRFEREGKTRETDSVITMGKVLELKFLSSQTVLETSPEALIQLGN